MKKQIIEIITFLLKDGVFPVLISFICLKVDIRHMLKREREKRIPTVYIVELAGKKRMQINKKRIAECEYIIEFWYRKYDTNKEISGEIEKALNYRQITYKELMRKIEEQPMYLIGFENYTDNGLCVGNLIDKDGDIQTIDKDIVPIHISKDNKYCLVCREDDIPIRLQGMFLDTPVYYNLEGKKDDSIPPQMKKNTRKLKRYLL